MQIQIFGLSYSCLNNLPQLNSKCPFKWDIFSTVPHRSCLGLLSLTVLTMTLSLNSAKSFALSSPFHAHIAYLVLTDI